MAADAPLTIVRPVSTGWIFLIAGAFFAALPIIIFVSVYRIDPGSAFSTTPLLILGTVFLLALWLARTGWRMARKRKVMMVLQRYSIILGQMYNDAMVEVPWRDLAGLEIWRPHALFAGQRDQLALGLTDAAAERLGLQEARPDPDAPGFTGAEWPFRKHFAFNAAHLGLSCDRIQEEVTARVRAARLEVEGPRLFHLGVVERKRWFFRAD